MDATYIFLQQYWWFLVSLLGAILVFLLFVQGGNSLLFCLGKTDEQRSLMVNSTGRKWEFTFTTLVTFGGAFFASFPFQLLTYTFAFPSLLSLIITPAITAINTTNVHIIVIFLFTFIFPPSNFSFLPFCYLFLYKNTFIYYLYDTLICTYCQF